MKIKIEPDTLLACGEGPLWDYPAHITRFIREFVNESGFTPTGNPDVNGLLPALSNLNDMIDRPPRYPDVCVKCPQPVSNGTPTTQSGDNAPMPPLEDAVAILRWAKGLS